MTIEIFLDNLGLVSGFRHGWKPWTKNKPNPNLVFSIYKTEFPKLVNFISGRPVVLGDEFRHDIKFGNSLFLVGLDYQNKNVIADKNFFNAVLN